MADRYWVGGTGNWNDTGKWSASSGGSSGASIPTTSDNVIFDSASSASSYVATIDATSSCLSFTASAPSSGNLTLAGSAGLTVAGSWSSYASMVFTHTGVISLTGAAVAIQTNGATLTSAMTLSGAGSTKTLSDSLTCGVFTLTSGTFSMNGFNLTATSFSSNNSNVRTLTMGSGTLEITGTGTVVNLNTTTNLTLNINTSTIHISNKAASAKNLNVGGLTFNNLLVNTLADGTSNSIASGVFIATNNATFNTVTVSDGCTFRVNNGLTLTVSSLVMSSTYGKNIFLGCGTTGGNATITKSGGGTNSISGYRVRDLTFTPGATWSASNSINEGNVTGMTFNAGSTRYWVGGSGDFGNTSHWSNTSGGASGAPVPLGSDNVVLDTNSSNSSYTLTISLFTMINNFSVSNPSSGVVTLACDASNLYFVGDTFSVSANTIVSGSGMIFFSGVSNTNMTTNGVVFSTPVLVIGESTKVFVDSFTTTGLFQLSRGVADFSTNNSSLTASGFALVNAVAVTRSINLGSATHTFTGASPISDATTGLGTTTINANTSTITINNSDTGNTKLIQLTTTQTLNNLQLFSAGGASAAVIVNCANLTLNTLSIGAYVNVKFTAGTNTTVSSVSAAGGIVITSNSAATHNLIKSGGGTVNIREATISYSVATPATTWYAYRSTDSGNNSGWTFPASTNTYAAISAISGLSGLSGLSGIM